MRESEAVFKRGGLDIKVVARAPYIGYRPVFNGLRLFDQAFDQAYKVRKKRVMGEKVKELMLNAEEKEHQNGLEIKRCGTTR